MKKIFLTLLMSFAILSCETTAQADSDYPIVIDVSSFEKVCGPQLKSM